MRERTLRREEAIRQRKAQKRHGVSDGASLSPESRASGLIVLLVLLPVVIVPLYFLVVPSSLSGLPLTGIIINEKQKYVAELTVLGLAIAIGGMFMARRNSWPVLPQYLLWPILVIGAALTVSLFQTVNPVLSLVDGLEVYLLPLLFFILVAGWNFTKKQALIIFFAALSAGGIVAAIGIYQAYHLDGGKTLLPHIGPGSLLFNKNLAGEYLVTLIPVGAAIALMPLKKILRGSALVLTLILMVHLVLTGARGAWVGLILGDTIALALAGAGFYMVFRKTGPETARCTFDPWRLFGLFGLVPFFLALIITTPWWFTKSVRYSRALSAIREMAAVFGQGDIKNRFLAVGLVGLVLALAGAAVFFFASRYESVDADRRYRPFVSLKTVKIPTMVLFLLVLVFSASWWSQGDSRISNPSLKRFSRMLSNPSSRLEIWGDTFELLSENWLAGVGPGHYIVQAPTVWGKSGRRPIEWDDKNGTLRYSHRPHNDYLQIWHELGIFGLLAVCSLFAAVCWIAAMGIGRAIIQEDWGRALIIKGALAGFVAFAVAMMFEFPFRMPASMLSAWICAGIAVSFARDGRGRLRRLPAKANIAMVLILLVIAGCSLALAHKKFWADFYDNKANWAWRHERVQDAYEWGERAYRYVPWEHDTALNQARTAFALKRFDAALVISRDLLEKYPHSLPGIWMRGISAYNSGRRKESRMAFSQLVTKFPNLKEVEKYKKLAGMPVDQKSESIEPPGE